MHQALSSTLLPDVLKLLDPAVMEGPAEKRWHALEQVALQLTTRLRHLLTLITGEQGACSS